MCDVISRPAFRGHDESVCQVLRIVLARLGFDTASFGSAKAAIAAFKVCRPQIVFLDIVLENSDAIDVVNELGETGYDGPIQLVTGASPELVAAVQDIGVRYGLRLRPALHKPFRGHAIREIVADLI